jgi:hypothetical protein
MPVILPPDDEDLIEAQIEQALELAADLSLAPNGLSAQ